MFIFYWEVSLTKNKSLMKSKKFRLIISLCNHFLNSLNSQVNTLNFKLESQEKSKKKKWIIGRKKNILKTTSLGNEISNQKIKSKKKLHTKLKFRLIWSKKTFHTITFLHWDNQELIKSKRKMLKNKEKRNKRILISNNPHDFKSLKAISDLERKKKWKRLLRKLSKKMKSWMKFEILKKKLNFKTQLKTYQKLTNLMLSSIQVRNCPHFGFGWKLKFNSLCSHSSWFRTTNHLSL